MIFLDHFYPISAISIRSSAQGQIRGVPAASSARDLQGEKTKK